MLQQQKPYDIEFSIKCPKRRSELLLDDIPGSEILIEELSAFTLTGIFDTVVIHNVNIEVAPGKDGPITIALRAQGIDPLRKVKNLDCLVEEKLTFAFAELFESVYVENFSI